MLLINKNAYPEFTARSLYEAQQFRTTARTLAEYKLFSIWFYRSENGQEKEINIDSFLDEIDLNDLNLLLESHPVEEYDFITGARREISRETEEVFQGIEESILEDSMEKKISEEK